MSTVNQNTMATTPSPPDGDNNKISFLSLPYEMRQQVYRARLIFRDRNGDLKVLNLREYYLRFKMCLPLLLANKLVHKEAQAVMLAENIIALKSSEFEPRLRDSLVFSSQHPDGRVFCWCFHNISTIEGWTCSFRMELPAPHLRPLMKRLELILIVPESHLPHFAITHRRLEEGENKAAAALTYDSPKVAWLYPLTGLKELGFGGLVLLRVKFVALQWTKEMEAWVKDRVAGMEVDTQELEIEFCVRDTFPGTTLTGCG